MLRLKTRDPPKYKKIPRKILVLAPIIQYIPEIAAEVDFVPKDTSYDLLIYIGKSFRLNLEFPFSIANSEIWFERAETFTRQVFERALWHYSECEIRNGI